MSLGIGSYLENANSSGCSPKNFVLTLVPFCYFKILFGVDLNEVQDVQSIFFLSIENNFPSCTLDVFADSAPFYPFCGLLTSSPLTFSAIDTM